MGASNCVEVLPKEPNWLRKPLRSSRLKSTESTTFWPQKYRPLAP